MSAMGTFFSAASSIQNSVASVAAQMLQSKIYDTWSAAGFASDAGSFSIELDTLASDLSSAADSMRSAVDAMDGAMSSINAELGSLGNIELRDFSAINGRCFQAYEYGKLQDFLSILRNLSQVV